LIYVIDENTLEIYKNYVHDINIYISGNKEEVQQIYMRITFTRYITGNKLK